MARWEVTARHGARHCCTARGAGTAVARLSIPRRRVSLPDDAAEQLKPFVEQAPVRAPRFPARHEEACAVNALEPVHQHGATFLIQDLAAKPDDVVGRDAEQLGVE